MSCQVRPSNTYLPKKPIDASLPEVGQAVGVPEGARGQPQPTATETRYGRRNRTRASASAPVGGMSGYLPPARRCIKRRCINKYADCLVSRQVAAATSSRTGHDARSPAQPVNVRPLPEGPPWCELNSGGAAARLWMAGDA